jgi:hypothetical protein
MRRIFAAVVLALLLAGCGGRAGHFLPTGRLGPDGAARGVRSSNTATFNGTLWYGDARSLYGIPLTYGAATTQINGSYAGLVAPTSRAMTVAPDGTLYELIQNNAAGPVGWQLRIYAPGSHGNAAPEETLSGSGYPLQVMLVADGIDVLSLSSQAGSRSATLSTFAYGSASNAPPIRTLSLGANVVDAATDRLNQIYVARSGTGVTVYPAAARCNCSPVRTIATGPLAPRSLAVANDGTVYVLMHDNAGEVDYVNAYAPGNNGPTGSRVLGPYYENTDVAPPGWPVSAATGGITVDAAGDLYLGFSDGGGNVRVEMYGAHDYGTTPPARTIATPTFSTYLTSIAIGPATSGIAPAPTLYVASASQVLAFDAGASGSAAPLRTVGGFYLNINGPPVGPGPGFKQTAWLEAIATAPDGTLTALQATNYSRGMVTYVPGCKLTLLAANANGSAGVLGRPVCDGFLPRGMARGLDGEIDFVMTRNAGDAQVVRRLVNGVPAGSLTLPPAAGGHNSLAVDRWGNFWMTTFGQVQEYAANSADGSGPVQAFALNGDLGAMCIAPDGTIYVASQVSSAPNPPSNYVYAVAPGTTVPARTLGPYPNPITALACDRHNLLYMGVSLLNGGGTVVKVFDANANGTPAPLRRLENPVPFNDPGGVTITSIALSP